MEYNPSDHPRASTIFLSKCQTDARDKRKSLFMNHGTKVGSLSEEVSDVVVSASTGTNGTEVQLLFHHFLRR
ncbi:hypothetical protein JZ751_000015 [Albula glossodonta]|uniref:Uncharacterized protein n=1 Tax=Albula glossodonta TaxID=121402 RepID=A0A8T2PUQ3_9TELE|nr:hypothetical protein JZ751_000015 [Albula glossodonta]